MARALLHTNRSCAHHLRFWHYSHHARKRPLCHKGLDLANTPKQCCMGRQDGIVVHKERYAFTGNTVVIDHGWGVLSLFFHLDSFANIKVGQKISKGNPIGTLGKTGYATGYHLHWEMRVKNNVQVDPIQWTKANF